ncbi:MULTISPECIES: hypothetical protein [Empedobacter]|jgi:hypothetical protein|uniref:hypothetical protein n=1 Tax=Empedobacter TaxID=59734 RepID=UPI00244A9DAA|nr:MULTISPECIES: hypothetical protein [Empedobacter]MDH1882021.1 hypothetical protein [Empedobacter sp. GD03797]MDM1041598.1 hypothetical protein [Empedobacter brevis]MDM1135268.1 hypothetical protein [Empedobacter sp. R750]
MSNLYVQIALDFVECTKEQKERFLLHLEDLNWKPLNPNKLWIAKFDNSENKENKLKNIEQEIIKAKEISKLYELDYAIIADEEIYFNQLT